MPDFERLIDSLRAELATSPEERAYAEGYTAGKSRARFEVLAVVVVLYFVLVVLYFGIALYGRMAGA
jgi:hypothetical protein